MAYLFILPLTVIGLLAMGGLCFRRMGRPWADAPAVVVHPVVRRLFLAGVLGYVLWLSMACRLVDALLGPAPMRVLGILLNLVAPAAASAGLAVYAVRTKGRPAVLVALSLSLLLTWLGVRIFLIN